MYNVYASVYGWPLVPAHNTCYKGMLSEFLDKIVATYHEYRLTVLHVGYRSLSLVYACTMGMSQCIGGARCRPKVLVNWVGCQSFFAKKGEAFLKH